MRDLRYHLLSLTAAGLGVALGLGLGAGPVTDRTVASDDATIARLHERADRLQESVARLTASAATDAEVTQALADPLTSGRLADRTVLVVATPGADKALVRRVQADLEAAGATLTGVLRLTEAYLDPELAQSPLEDLALRLVPPGVEFPDGASPIERVGTVLARATVRAPADKDATDRDAAEVIAGLDELDALRLDGDPGRRAELAVLVTGTDEAADSEPALAGLLVALDAGSAGAVLAGPGDAGSGPLRWVRGATEDRLDVGVSTVDSLDAPVGAAALVLALAEQAAGGAGHYGLGRGAGGVLPAVAAGG